MGELSEKFNKEVVSIKDIETTEKNEWEMKNTIIWNEENSKK